MAFIASNVTRGTATRAPTLLARVKESFVRAVRAFEQARMREAQRQIDPHLRLHLSAEFMPGTLKRVKYKE